VSRPPVTTAVDAVAADLESRIVAGELPPGTRLREQSLAEHYDVARHTVRAALRVLASRRLADIQPHRGAHVRLLDGRALQGLFELRAALEVEAVRLLALRDGLDPLPAPVLAAAADLEAACSRRPEPDRGAVDAAHARLHHALVEAAGSDRITGVHAGLTIESRVALVQSREHLPVADMARTHAELFAGLASRGPEALREHLDHGLNVASAGIVSPDQA